MAYQNAKSSSKILRTVGFVMISALISYAAAAAQKKVERALRWKRIEKNLDRSLESSMDCSDPVAKY